MAVGHDRAAPGTRDDPRNGWGGPRHLVWIGRPGGIGWVSRGSVTGRYTESAGRGRRPGANTSARVDDLEPSTSSGGAAEPGPFLGPGTAVATLVAGILAAVAAAMDPAARHGLAVALAVGCYLALATAGMAWAERRSPRRTTELLALQVPFVAAALVLSEGRAFLAAMPLISMSVLYLRQRVALAITAALIALFAWIALTTFGAQALQGCIGFSSSAVFVVVFSQLARRERLARAEVERLVGDLRHANARLADYAARVEELATIQERNRIAREIHDGLGHTLTVASMQLEAVRARPEDAPARLERVQHILREGLGELRRSVSMLRGGPSTPQAFARAIEELVAEHEGSELQVELVTEGTPRPLPGALGFALYRAAQEALTNVRRHAGARAAEVRLAYRTGSVALMVSDDGVGAAELVPGHGLSGLRERVALVGGTVEIESRPGVVVRVEVPA